MSDGPIRLLFVDDERVDQMAFTRMVQAQRLPYECDLASSVAEAGHYLREKTYDVVVTDYQLGDGTAFELFDLAGSTPVIVATGMGDEAVAVQALKRGAYDYVIKDARLGYLTVLPLTIDKSLAQHRSILEREEAQRRQRQLHAQIEQSHDDLLAILNLLRLGIALTDENGRLVFLSETCSRILQRDPQDCRGRHWEEVCPFSPSDKRRLAQMAAAAPAQRDKIAVRLQGPDGQSYAMEVEVKDDPRNLQRRIFLLYDMTAVHDLRRLLNQQSAFEGMVGKTEVMQAVFEQVKALAALDTTVLIEGETGTGKELVAQAIHHTGPRREGRFVPLNCAGLTESLLASQLFGHRRGAFTGAVEDRCGVFETASGGTLFLDEIGDVSSGVQTSLLRVLEEKEIVRLGESTARPVDVRIIAATHRDLNEEVRQGRFRSDLLYRVRVARLALPPLRDRRTDIPLLAHAFLRDFRAASGKAVHEIASAAMGRLFDYYWPGNVRELASAIEFASIRCRGPVIHREDLPPEILDGEAPAGPPAQAGSGDERSRLLAALQRARGNRAAAARLMGISRATFYRRLQEMKIGN